MTKGGPTVRARGCKFRGGRGTLSGGICCDQGTGSLTIDGCEFDPCTATWVINLAAPAPAGFLEGSGNRFRNGATISGSDTDQQRLTRRHAVNPNIVTSAARMSTATPRCTTTTRTSSAAPPPSPTSPTPQKCTGILRLVVAAGASWSTANTGNIQPKITAARTPGDVVTLLFEPTAGKWLELG